MNCSRNMITNPKKNSIAYIYILVTVAIIIPLKIWEEENS